MPGRTAGADQYRYGFNGQERSDEVNAGLNNNTAEFWQYDARIGRRWNVDPVFKPCESPYSAFGGNPIANIDPNGADTINITRTTTTVRVKGRSDGHSDNLVTPSGTFRSVTGSIDIKAAKGEDVFQITDVNIVIDEDGKETSSSKTTTLDIRGQASLYRNGGHNMPGYVDDRYALASVAPTWLLTYYANKNKGFDTPTEWGLGAAKAYQKDMPFFTSVQKITHAVYTVTGIYGLARMTLAASLPALVREESWFAGTRYTSKVWKQMQLGDMHAFPEGVKAFEKYGVRSTITGGDGVTREMLKIEGTYKGKDGFFEFIKEADGSINHRLFRPN